MEFPDLYALKVHGSMPVQSTKGVVGHWSNNRRSDVKHSGCASDHCSAVYILVQGLMRTFQTLTFDSTDDPRYYRVRMIKGAPGNTANTNIASQECAVTVQLAQFDLRGIVRVLDRDRYVTQGPAGRPSGESAVRVTNRISEQVPILTSY